MILKRKLILSLIFPLVCIFGCVAILSPVAYADESSPVLHPVSLKCTGFKMGYIMSSGRTRLYYDDIHTGQYEAVCRFDDNRIYGNVYSATLPEDWVRPGTWTFTSITYTLSFSELFSWISDFSDESLYTIQDQNIIFGFGIPGYTNPYWINDVVVSFGSYYDYYSDSQVSLEASIFADNMSYVEESGVQSSYYMHMYSVTDIFNAAGGATCRVQGLDQINITFEFSGTPSDRYIEFFWTDANFVTGSLDNVNQSLSNIVDSAHSSAVSVSNDLNIHPDAQGVEDINAFLLQDFFTYDDELSLFRPRSSSSFVTVMISVGVSSLSIALISYILFGKKG